ncbi:MAG TPA: pyridoxal-phosphate dependent enzyme [Planctomycetota bacterium]|nr:pyridoxal-phosphate dependent enzyme [Planctomycetota bacterium]
MQPLTPIPLAEIQAAAERIQGLAVRTPLVRLPTPGPAEIWLKLENLQPIGSFKLRGAGNALALLSAAQLADGVYTASAGNMAQGVAFVARRRSVPCRVVVPDHAPATKLAAIERLGAEIVKLPFAEWWNVLLQRGRKGMRGWFVHPVSDPAVIAGNGTIGLEILADLPDVDTVVVPYGGGGLASGIASALRPLRPTAEVFAAEVATAAPLAAALAAGAPAPIDYVASFVDGIGGRGLLPEMWPMVRELLAGSVVVTLEQVADAIRLLVERNRIVAEGAGAASVAAALTGRAGAGKIVCVVSGGNLDPAKLARILANELP